MMVFKKSLLLKEGIITEKDDDKMAADARDEMEKAVEFALKSKEPSPEDALKDIYCSS